MNKEEYLRINILNFLWDNTLDGYNEPSLKKEQLYSIVFNYLLDINNPGISNSEKNEPLSDIEERIQKLSDIGLKNRMEVISLLSKKLSTDYILDLLFIKRLNKTAIDINKYKKETIEFIKLNLQNNLMLDKVLSFVFKKTNTNTNEDLFKLEQKEVLIDLLMDEESRQILFQHLDKYNLIDVLLQNIPKNITEAKKITYILIFYKEINPDFIIKNKEKILNKLNTFLLNTNSVFKQKISQLFESLNTEQKKEVNLNSTITEQKVFIVQHHYNDFFYGLLNNKVGIEKAESIVFHLSSIVKSYLQTTGVINILMSPMSPITNNTIIKYTISTMVDFDTKNFKERLKELELKIKHLQEQCLFNDEIKNVLIEAKDNKIIQDSFEKIMGFLKLKDGLIQNKQKHNEEPRKKHNTSKI